MQPAVVLLLQSVRELSPIPHAGIKERTKTGPKRRLGLHCHPYLMSPRARPRPTTFSARREPHPNKLSLSFPGPWTPAPHTHPSHPTLV